MQVIVFSVGLNESHGLPASHCWLNDLSLHLASYSFDFSVFSFSIFLFFTWLSSLKISNEGHFFILHCENVNTNVSRILIGEF